MSKGETQFNVILKKVTKVCGFIADVVKAASSYVFRKTKEYIKKRLNGRSFFETLKGGAVSVFNKLKGLSLLPKALLAIFAVLLICFISVNSYCSSHFLPGTTLCGVDVSNMSIKEAKTAITSACDGYELAIFEKGGKAETVKGEDIELNVTISKKFNSILKLRSGYFWLGTVLKNESVDIKGTVQYTYNEAKLDEIVSSLECMHPATVQAPVDAELYYSDGEFKIRPELTGNTVDENSFKTRIKQAIEAQERSLDLEAENLYASPQVRADDPSLQNKIDALQSISGVSIVLKFGEDQEIIDGETISNWYTVSSSGDPGAIILDEGKLNEYVSQLAAKYNTINAPKQFVTHYGDTIEIANSFYGWELDCDYTAEKIKECVIGKSSASFDLTDRSEEGDKWWLQVGVSYDDLHYYGNTYAEVSIEGQYMWMYQNGEVVFESDVVTGMPDTEHDTPVGIYSIIYKEQNATLRGDGYETVVAYWMVFTVDIGFHDADWQDAFGDDMYEYNGSHGCVNLPVEAAAELYELVYPGMPVFVY